MTRREIQCKKIWKGFKSNQDFRFQQKIDASGKKSLNTSFVDKKDLESLQNPF